jgi:hypothetical protein
MGKWRTCLKKLKKLVPNRVYRFKKKFYAEAPPLHWYAEKGETAVFEGKSLGYAHMRADKRLILMSKKEVFQFLEEIE